MTGDRLALGVLRATVEAILGHPRLVRLAFDGSLTGIWEGIARDGRPIQYSHITRPLALWDVWTPIAGPPVAFESPEAGFVLDWNVLASLKRQKVQFATITHAADISSTLTTALAVRHAQMRGGHVIAVGTTVVRALEHVAESDGLVRVGSGLATQRIGSATRLRVVDAILSGTHAPGTSHYNLLRAFVNDATLLGLDPILFT